MTDLGEIQRPSSPRTLVAFWEIAQTGWKRHDLADALSLYDIREHFVAEKWLKPLRVRRVDEDEPLIVVAHRGAA